MKKPILNQRVYPMIGIFNDGLRDLPAMPGATPAERHVALSRLFEKGAEEDYVESETIFATSSFCLAAFSSYLKARAAGLETPAAVARRSTKLLDTTWLEHNAEQALHQPPISLPVPGPGHIKAIRPDLLVITNTEAGAAVDYAPLLRDQLDARGPEEAEHCPAPRRTIELFYQRYVDVVFTPGN